MAHVPYATGSLWLFAPLVLGVVFGPLAMRLAGRRQERFRWRLESAYARYDRPVPGGIPCPSCRSITCACPAG